MIYWRWQWNKSIWNLHTCQVDLHIVCESARPTSVRDDNTWLKNHQHSVPRSMAQDFLSPFDTFTANESCNSANNILPLQTQTKQWKTLKHSSTMKSTSKSWGRVELRCKGLDASHKNKTHRCTNDLFDLDLIPVGSKLLMHSVRECVCHWDPR